MPATVLTEQGALSVVAVAATASASAAPVAATFGIDTSDFSTVRVFTEYVGQVDTAGVTMWVRNRKSNAWAKLGTLAPALAPGGATAVNEARDIVVGRKQEIYPQLTTITGGGTVAVTVAGVWVEKSA